ncbi:MAG: DUF366 family protein [Methanobacteriaceae archaeon]
MNIAYKHISENIKYDGSQIEPSWAFRTFKIKGSTVITFRGPMDISADNLKDFEDIGLEIKSDDMIHFIVEHFDIQPADLRTAYHRQRILVMLLKEELSRRGIISTRKGDDIYVNGSKLTVSIAIASISSMKIHLGINIRKEGTPDDVDAIGIFECKSHKKTNNASSDNTINENNINEFIETIANNYINELNDIEMDISKTNTG